MSRQRSSSFFLRKGHRHVMRRFGIPLLLAVFSLFAGMLATAPPAAAKAVPPPVKHQKPVPVHAVHGKKVSLPKVKAWHPVKTVWPSAGSATVTPGSSATRAGSAPVWVSTIGGSPEKAAAPKASSSAGASSSASAKASPSSRPSSSAPARPSPSSKASPAAPKSSSPSPSASPAKQSSASLQSTSSSPGKVKVSVAPEKTASALGVHGMVFSVGHAAPATAGRVRVKVDYSSFQDAYGGDYPGRLRLVEMPACAVTTPQVAACRKVTPLATRNDAGASTVSADVPLPSGTSAATVATAPSPSGDEGDYSATKLSEAGKWAEGGNSGAFTYSYPISVPPEPGGLAPKVELDYNSQTVDGMTSSTDNQASDVGDGWSYDPGSISVSYPSCEQQPPGASAWTKEPDLCDSSDAPVTLTLNGKTTKIVRNTGSDGTVTYHAADDGDEKITTGKVEANGAGNGSRSGQYWIVTEPDGTQYYFGMNHIPGWASGDATTNSADDVPLHDDYAKTDAYTGACPQSFCWYPYRWNLDYVVDPHGDAEVLFYSQEKNYYAESGSTTATEDYEQASALSKIQYGFRDKTLFSGGTPAGEVDFTTAEDRTDIPTDAPNDLACASGSACQVNSPTFWSKYRLTGISTRTWVGGTNYQAVDSWALSQSWPPTGDASTKQPAMWLDSITQTGQDGGSVKLPPVTFGHDQTAMANRVEPSSDLDSNGDPKYSYISRFRMTSVTNETGGVTDIAYTGADNACAQGTYPSADANTTMCYPDWWSDNITDPDNPALTESWFNKYAVSSVTEKDTTGGNPDQVTHYTYSGPAWHYTEDPTVPSSVQKSGTDTTKVDERTWDVWRGFRTVTTETGASPDPVTKKTDTYLQGMDGDPQSGGGTSSVSVSDSQGDSVPDSDQYQGQMLEDVVYNGDSGSMVTDTVTLPWSAKSGATQSQPSPIPDLQSYFTGTQETKVYTALAGGGNRESDTTNTYDDHGRVYKESDVPDTKDSSQDTCTTTTYADNADLWIMSLSKEVQKVAVPCTDTSPSYPQDAISDTRTYYDGATDMSSGTTCNGTSEPADTPCKGDVTKTDLATSYDSNGNPQYTTQNTSTYDGYGRVLTSADADNRTTTTDYSPSNREPTQETMTDPQGLQTVTKYDPARELPTSTTSPAGLTATETYDALGRLTAVWMPGDATSGPASMKFAYTVSAAAPSYTVTSTLDPDASGYLDSVTIFDSFGNTVEGQEQQPGGGWDITDTTYDSNGKQTLTAGPYYAGTVTEGTLVEASKDDVADETNTVYDGAGRTVKSVAEDKNTETWETDTSYGGDYTTTSYKCSSSVPKCGGTPETVFTDGRGLKTAIYQYHAGTSPDPGDDSSDYDKTTYSYFPSQKLKEITDATGGNKWDYTYDLSGNELTDADPDAGKTTDTYDAANQLVTSTDARNKQVSYVYDKDGRKTAEYDTTGGASETSSDEIASWIYDTEAKGQLTSSSSYYNGDAYTEKTLGYNAFGEPTGTEVTIPSSQGKLAGTYITEDKAYAKTGELESYEDSAAGGLPAETVNYTYDADGAPTSVQGISSYVNSLSYDELGNPQQYSMGSSSEPAYVTDSYDPQTQKLTEQQTSTGTTPKTIDDLKYSYDNVGNVLAENDQPSGAAAQSQCFSYDYLGRLTQAWSQGSACDASSSPSTSSEGGAAAPYWNTYTYDTIGNLTKQTSEQPDGTVTTTKGTFPSTGSAQPHAATSETQSGGPGTSTTSYQYDADGDLTSSSANTVTGTLQSQSLSWDDAGRLSSITSPSGGATPSTSYFYDADGNLLIEQDPGKNTLFLPDEQLVENTVTGTVTGTRYYTIGGSGTSTSSGTTGNASDSADSSSSGSDGGGTTASNSASSSASDGTGSAGAANSSSGGGSSGAASSGIGSAGSSSRGAATVACRTSSGVDYLVGDQQGTAGIAIDAGTLVPTQRYYDPYGNPVGTTPANWPGGDKGFVGGTESKATGLTNLGAREYQPQAEAFISPDSILNPDNPQDLNAYAYGADNPATESDPSGQCAESTNQCTGSVPAMPAASTKGSGTNSVKSKCPSSMSTSTCETLLGGVPSNSSPGVVMQYLTTVSKAVNLENELWQLYRAYANSLKKNSSSSFSDLLHPRVAALVIVKRAINVNIPEIGMQALESGTKIGSKVAGVLVRLVMILGTLTGPHHVQPGYDEFGTGAGEKTLSSKTGQAKDPWEGEQIEVRAAEKSSSAAGGEPAASLGKSGSGGGDAVNLGSLYNSGTTSVPVAGSGDSGTSSVGDDDDDGGLVCEECFEGFMP